MRRRISASGMVTAVLVGRVKKVDIIRRRSNVRSKSLGRDSEREYLRAAWVGSIVPSAGCVSEGSSTTGAKMVSRVKWRSEMVAWRLRDHSHEIDVAALFRSLL